MFKFIKNLFKRKKGGDSPRDFTFHSSEMRGELRYKNKQHEKAMKAPIKDLDKKLRKKGLI